MRALCLAASLALIAPALLRSQEPAFSSKVEAVRVDALVTERGQPVRGLRAADFEVIDNGVTQDVDLVSFEQVPLNLVLVFDMSSSVVGERLDHLRDGARTVLEGLKPDDQAGLITFSHMVVRGSELTTDLNRVRAALRGTFWPGQTALIDAVYSAIVVGEADVGRALLIVFSDGLDTASWLTEDAVLDTAKRSDVVVYGVAAGGSPQMSFLRNLSELTGGALLDAGSTENLGTTFERILREFRQRYLISYSPRGVRRPGWHRLDVRIKGRAATVKARPGYLAD
jgi:Ca-activated chloride channel homolog